LKTPWRPAIALQVDERLAELGNLLPDMVGKMDRARADVLYELLKDPTATADRLLALRQLLPHCNVSALVAGHPKLMLGMTVSRGRMGCCSSRCHVVRLTIAHLHMTATTTSNQPAAAASGGDHVWQYVHMSSV
jgi:hypothetical protein